MEKWDQKVEGMHHVKEEFLLYLTDYISNSKINPKILTLHGPPGCGKTLFVQSLGEILGLPVEWIDMAGLNEVNFLKGFSKTFEGSEPGRLIKSLINMKSMRGIIVLEEIDKVESTLHGKEVLQSLIPILDRTRNDKFYDNYLSDLYVSLSNIIFIITINDDKAFSRPLYDRLNIINIEKPTLERKLKIAHNYVIPSALSSRMLDPAKITFSDDTIKYIISKYTKNDGKVEDGVRSLKEKIQSIIQRVNFYIQTAPTAPDAQEEDILKYSVKPNEEGIYVVTPQMVDTLLQHLEKKAENLHNMYM
jgi:ATP-dependent Lon protease